MRLPPRVSQNGLSRPRKGWPAFCGIHHHPLQPKPFFPWAGPYCYFSARLPHFPGRAGHCSFCCCHPEHGSEARVLRRIASRALRGPALTPPRAVLTLSFSLFGALLVDVLSTLLKLTCSGQRARDLRGMVSLPMLSPLGSGSAQLGGRSPPSP